MDPARFDALVRVASRAGSRRGVLGGLAALALIPLTAAAGRRTQRHHHHHPGGPGTCRAGQTSCPVNISCNGSNACICRVTVGGMPFCSQFGAGHCASCQTDADCVAATGAGSACVPSLPACVQCGGGNSCERPCRRR